MRCIQCGREMEMVQGIYHYTESGLDNVKLMNVPIHRCPLGHESEVEIPRAEELHLLIAFLLIFKSVGLTGKEARYLRKHLGLTAEELAEKIGVTRVTVARWERKQDGIRTDHDKHLRRLYLEKKLQDPAKLPSVRGIIYLLVGSLPLDRKKRELKIRTEDCVSDMDQVAV